MRIGILNSGGDCPGLNAVIHGAVGAANELGWEIIGFRDGFEGLLPGGPGHKLLTLANTLGIQGLGGTILGTTNKGNFAAKIGIDQVSSIPTTILEAAKQQLLDLKVQGLILAGGDGSLTTGLQLWKHGVPVVGVPKTIDNDLKGTSMTFGFDSAVSVVVDALDRLHTTAESHQRVMVVEVMGRHAGWIALHSGFSGGADIVLLPEIDFTMEHVAQRVRDLFQSGQRSVLIVVAEGCKLESGALMTQQADAHAQVKLGGIGAYLAKTIESLTGRETRDVRLGHLQRGGAPTPWDRMLGTRFGVKAVQLIKEKKFGRMVNFSGDQVGDVAIEEAVDSIHRVDPQSELVRAARSIGICFGDR